MKILAIADKKPESSVQSIVAQHQIDLICVLGDLTFFDLRELENITTIPKIGVYGNHCSGKYFERLGIQNIHLKTFEYNGLVFGGFAGSVRYKSSGTFMFTQEEANNLLKNFPPVDVMLAHSPPYGINDEPQDLVHQGFRALREYIITKKPQYFIHGHTHPTAQDLKEELGDTKIVYVFGEKIINVE